MVRRCYLCNKSKNENHNLTLHLFPKEENLRQKWKDACNLTPIDDVSNVLLCSKHFHPQEDYKGGNPVGRTLTPFAVPWLSVPNPPPEMVNKMIPTRVLDHNYAHSESSSQSDDVNTNTGSEKLAEEEIICERNYLLQTSDQGENELIPEPVATAGTVALEFDASLSEDERRFYTKAYPSIDLVRERKVHCTVCKVHIGTAPSLEGSIKMHPILRVTHCQKCHDFYNSGEFSKGEDGSELYCRWCGQGGEVYCCSNCPYVFCKSCIVKNLSRGVVADIEQNENWSCFSCAPKILWPLRAQHWALINYIDKQKKSIQSQNLNDSDLRNQMARDLSTCCRLAKAKCGNMSDSMESLDSVNSRRSLASAGSITKKTHKLSVGGGSASQSQSPAPKRQKTNNDDIVCTPDLMSMLEPDCQLTMSPKPRSSAQSPATSTPKVLSIQTAYGGALSTPRSSSAGGGNSAQPPPLVMRNTGIHMRPIAPAPVVRRTVVGPRTPTPGGNAAPVYHTINGYRIDLNSAAQQETFRLPNGKLIQVKRQGTQHHPNSNPNASPTNNWQQQRSPMQQPIQLGIRPVQITQSSQQPHHHNQSNITIHMPTAGGGVHHPQQHPQMVRYHNTMVGNTTVTPLTHANGGAQIQVINGAPNNASSGQQQQQQTQQGVARPLMVRHIFPDTAIGQARTQLQDQVFNAMEICQHLTGKVQTLTNSNAYKQARNYLEVKELYIHLSYLLTYAIGRFKGLQDKCLGDMRQLGFGNDADSLENGQLAAGVDYVRYGQLEEADFFNTGCNSFHNQVYEYRKNLHENLEDGVEREPLSPLMPLGVASRDEDDENDAEQNEDDGGGGGEDNWAEAEETGDDALDDGPDEPEESYMDSYLDQDDGADDDTTGIGGEDDSYLLTAYATTSNEAYRSTEDVMRREEQSHAYDRKLTRLIEQYPSIWCTRHPDYGNFDVTRKQWRTIAAHFKRSENMKLRWKNIRKRFVRIERRLRDGKRFNGYFDKATNFLSNRDLPQERWSLVDRGETDGDAVYDRKQLDSVEKALHPNEDSESGGGGGGGEHESRSHHRRRFSSDFGQLVKPIELRQSDLRIINFVKCNPVLWRKASEPVCNKIDEHSRRSLWMHLWKSMPNLSCDDIIDRWQHLYEMYKTFRLKTIRNDALLAQLELKYSKYLAKLYFLYKIDEEELRNEQVTVEDYDDDDAENQPQAEDTKLQDMPDDKEFIQQLVIAVRPFPALWNTRHVDYHDIALRKLLWLEVTNKLQEFKREVRTIKLRWQLAKFSYFRLRRERRHLGSDAPLLKCCKNLPVKEMSYLDAIYRIQDYKQASDDEDNEIEIVEPKTDTITLDSDNDDDDEQLPPKPLAALMAKKTSAIKTATTTTSSSSILQRQAAATTPNNSVPIADDDSVSDFLSTAQSILASMLEVDLVEGDQQVPGPGGSPGGSSGGDSAQKKQPRKKTTHKPNPTLLRQKEILERQRLEEMKRNDHKLKMKCAIELKKAEDEFPFAKEMLNEKETLEKPEDVDDDDVDGVEDKKEKNEDEVELVEVMEVDDIDSSGEECTKVSDSDVGDKDEKTEVKQIDKKVKESNDKIEKKISDDKVEGVSFKEKDDIKETEASKEELQEKRVLLTNEEDLKKPVKEEEEQQTDKKSLEDNEKQQTNEKTLDEPVKQKEEKQLNENISKEKEEIQTKDTNLEESVKETGVQETNKLTEKQVKDQEEQSGTEDEKTNSSEARTEESKDQTVTNERNLKEKEANNATCKDNITNIYEIESVQNDKIKSNKEDDNSEESGVPKKKAKINEDAIEEITATEKEAVEEDVKEDVEMTDLETAVITNESQTAEEKSQTQVEESVEMIELSEEQVDESEEKSDNDSSVDKAEKECNEKDVEVTVKEMDLLPTEQTEIEEDLDVDKEIAKLLQKKDCEAEIVVLNEAVANELASSSSKTEIDANITAKKVNTDLVATADEADAAAASPNLFNDITELIEKENNAMT